MTKAKREFKFYPCDFKELIAKPMHMDLVFDMNKVHFFDKDTELTII